MIASARAEAIRVRTYARPTPAGYLETWGQTVDRVMSHQAWLWERAKGTALNQREHDELTELRALILARKVFPSGRILWMGGTETIRRRESASLNCSFLRIQTVHDVVDAFWLLLQGCGVGFEPVPGILNGFAAPLEVVALPSEGRTGQHDYNIESVADGVWTIRVGDSAEAWAKAAGKLVAGKPPRVRKLVLDFAAVRPAGSRLKGYGWLSSGDATVRPAFLAVAGILNRRAGRLLTRVDILDIINHLGTTLSSRRSAQIALMPYRDDEADDFIHAKKDCWKDNPHRMMSNNSLLIDHTPSKAELYGLFAMMSNAGGSEPGFINVAEAKRRAPWYAGGNPCLTGDTLIPTANGFVRIADVVNQDVVIRDGNGSMVSARVSKTGTGQEVYDVEFSDGSVYAATAYHSWVLADGNKRETRQLCKGDSIKPSDVRGMFGPAHDPKQAYIDAWLAADGSNTPTKNGSRLELYAPKFDHQPELEACGAVFKRDYGKYRVANFSGYRVSKDRVPSYVLRGDRETVIAYLRGALQSDGCIYKHPTYHYWHGSFSSCRRAYLQDLQALLRLFGLRSKLTLTHPAQFVAFPDGNGGHTYSYRQPCYRLCVNNAPLLLETLDSYPAGYTNPHASSFKPRPQTFVSATLRPAKEDVYCLSVPTTASFDLATVHSGNCNEILLGNRSVCNLTEVVVTAFDSPEARARAVYLAARMNYRQTCINLDDGILQRSWEELNQFLRLCGLGLTGLAGWSGLCAPVLRQLREHAHVGANDMARELGLPRAKAITTVKPSGTLSKVANCSEGVHTPLAQYLINNVSFSRHDPLLERLEAARYRVFDHPTQADARLVAFPVEYASEHFTEVDGSWLNMESAVDQLDRYKLLMDNYIDHNCSTSISYSPDEIPAMVDWLAEHWDSYVGTAFLPRVDPTKTAASLGYAYLPQEACTDKAYRDYVQTLKPLDLDGLLPERGPIPDAGECAGGACPVR